MPTQLEMLKETVARLEAKGGKDNPFVQGLRAQIAAHERRALAPELREQMPMSTGTRTAPSDDRPSK